MMVFQESDLEGLLDAVITSMKPQRSPSQKPVPANVIFLASRYAHYYADQALLERLLGAAIDRINDVVEKYQWDMTVLAFWIANVTLLLHYIQKDRRILAASAAFQPQLVDLINEVFILIIRDAERRIDRVLDAAMLNHEPILGFEEIRFQDEWRFFRSKAKAEPIEPEHKRFRPPSPKARAKPSPVSVTSLLSSTLFVLDLYDVHSSLIVQIVAQLFYWIGAEIFNRVIANRQYLARTKAMQIRMNLSVLEDWARGNDRRAEHLEDGAVVVSGQTSFEAARIHLSPAFQLLQWLQCFSHIGDDQEMLVATVQQLPNLLPSQLLHAASHYRLEVGEKGLSRSAKTSLGRMMNKHGRSRLVGSDPSTDPKHQLVPGADSGHWNLAKEVTEADDTDSGDRSEQILLDPALMLPFSLPTTTEMYIQYGLGGSRTQGKAPRLYVPTVPPEFLAKLDTNNLQQPEYSDLGNQDWAD